MFPSHIPRIASRAALLGVLAATAAAGPALAKAAPPPPAAPAPAPAAPAPTKASITASITPSSVTSQLLSSLDSVVDTTSCAAPALVQPFLSWKDQNDYTLAPGESNDSFDGTGWTLIGGASIEAKTLADGQTGDVLDLPSGSYAVSPPMCVASDYPTARTMLQTSGDAQLGAGVFYAANKAAQQLQLSGIMQGSGSGFTLSAPLQVHPGNLAGWQQVQFLFGATGTKGDAQVYNFYVDPRMSR